MVAFRLGVALLRLAPLLAFVVATTAAGRAAAEDEAVEPLPPVSQTPRPPEITEGAPSAVVPWEPNDGLEVLDADGKDTYPSWNAVRVEALLLWRDAPQSVPLVASVGETGVAGSPQRGSTHTGGSVVLQGINLGLEGRW